MRIRWVLFAAGLVIIVSFWGYQRASTAPTGIRGIWVGRLLDGNDAVVGNVEWTISSQRNFTGMLVPIKTGTLPLNAQEKTLAMQGHMESSGEITGALKSASEDIKLFDGNTVLSHNRLEGTIVLRNTPYKLRLERK